MYELSGYSSGRVPALSDIQSSHPHRTPGNLMVANAKHLNGRLGHTLSMLDEATPQCLPSEVLETS